MTHDEIRKKITGPVFPVVIPFTENEDVDYAALERYVEFLIENGAGVILVTVGTSRFNLLTADEIKKVNEVVVTATNKRAVAIVAGPGPTRGSTRENIEFARHAKKIGADAILLLYPERWYGDEPVRDFFNTVAQAVDVGIMIHSVPIRDGFGGVLATTCINLDVIADVAENKNVIGVKEESGNRKNYENLLARFKDSLAIIGAGGAMERFTGDHKLGAITYLVGIGSFKPDLAVEFYHAVMDGKDDHARMMVEKFEKPYFSFAVSLGWHRALKQTMALLGVIPGHERAPMDTLTDEQNNALKETLRTIGWL